jgi:putative ABC transport system permease protein
VIARALIGVAALLHALVLRLYPARFRRRFGSPMTLAVRDALSETARRDGSIAVAITGARSIGDALGGVAPARAAAARDRLLWPEPAPNLPRRTLMVTDSVIADGRFALRTLRRAPLFTVATITALALGLGATTAIFAVVRGVLLQPLPYHAPDRLVMLWSDNTREQRPQNPIAPADFIDYRDRARSFEGVETMYAFLLPQRLQTASGVEVAQGAIVTPGMFALLGRTPALGRTFARGETRGVVILSHGYWQRRFGSDPGVIGRVLPLVDQVAAMNAGSPLRGAHIIGVMPPDFVFPYRSMLGPSGFSRATDVDIWLPLAFEGDRFVDAGGYNRRVRMLAAVARLKPEASVESARAELKATARQLEQAWPATNTGWGATVTPLLDQTVGGVRPALLVLLAGVVFLLTLTCVNVANLLLARGVARQREVAVRLALGAGRRRLIQQSLIEGLVLALAGGLAALAVARWGMTALLALAPVDLPRLHAVSIDGGVLMFAAAAALAAGLVVGAVSALAATGFELSGALRDAGRGAVGAQATRRTRAALVVAEVALAVVLTVGAGLLIRSFVTLLNVDPGFRPESLLTLQMNVPDAYNTPPRRLAYYQALFARLEAIPGVRAVGGTTRLPLGSTNVTTSIAVEGRDTPESALPETEMRRGMHDYFTAMGIPLLEGRTFSREDGPGAVPVAVINRALADRLFGRSSPLGHRVRMGGGPGGSWLTIVGVVGNIRHQGLEVAPAPEIYIHYMQGPPVAPFLVVRAAGDPAGLGDAVRAAILEVDRATPVFDIRTMMEVRSASVSQRRFVLALTALFGALALVLAGLGVYSVMALIVAERRQEVGVRLALGARPVTILGLVLRQCLGLTSIGVAVGLVLAAALAPAMATQLYGVSAFDPLTFVVIPIVLAGVATLAASVPARAAMRVDPVSVLRGD